MSAIKKSYWRAGSAALGFFTLIATAHAQQALPAVTTVGVAHAMSIPYDLKPGKSTRAIRVPANVPVHLIGVQIASGNDAIPRQSVGEVTLLSFPPNINWVGLESPFNTGRTNSSTITSGTSLGHKAGTHIVFLDFYHEVDVEVASLGTIKIVNKGPNRCDFGACPAAIGSITLIW